VITIDASATEPPYDQIRRQVASLVAAGRLAPGDKLPTVRRLAADLGLAANTVARAYRELEAAAEYAAVVRSLGLSVADALALVERSLAH
jgi:DNA-binding transcriptional regulator YhcF (GntR family)